MGGYLTFPIKAKEVEVNPKYDFSLDNPCLI
jgi:hypothetical protein